MNHLPMPGNTKAEEQVLACVLMNPRLITTLVDRLKPEHFATESLSNIYDCMIALLAERKAATVFNVASELVKRNMRTEGVEQAQYEMYQISDTFALDTDIDDYVTFIIDASKFRRGIQACASLAASFYHQDKESLQKAIEIFSLIAHDGDLRDFTAFGDALDTFMAEYEQTRRDHQEGKIAGLSTGFKTIDRFFRFFPEDLNILAARTSIGKTSWALNVALHIAKEALRGGAEVAFFSLEMSQKQLVQRLLSTDSLIDQTSLRDGKTTDEEDDLLHMKAKELRSIGLHISDSARHIDEIKSNSRVICSKRKIGLIIVDYLQLVKNGDGHSRQPRHEAIADISRDLKQLAQQLKVPVLALAQLNRESERQNEPQLTNLGESDAIGRDADTVSFIHITQEEIEKRNQAQDYNVVFKVRKNRQGPLGEVNLGFRPRQTRFVDLMEEY